MDGSVDARDPIRIMGEKLAPRITMHTDRGVKLRLRSAICYRYFVFRNVGG